MKIGITGAHSTGKTTLLNALRSEEAFKHFSICDEVTRQVQAYGLPINEKGNDITQRLIMNQHIVNLALHTNMITDRTSLDGLLYTTWLYNNGKVEKSTLDYAQQVFDVTWSMYDVVFYTPIEFDIVNDGVRSVDPAFRNEIGKMFEDFTSTCKRRPVVTLTGSVYTRLQTVFETIKQRGIK